MNVKKTGNKLFDSFKSSHGFGWLGHEARDYKMDCALEYWASKFVVSNELLAKFADSRPARHFGDAILNETKYQEKSFLCMREMEELSLSKEEYFK